MSVADEIKKLIDAGAEERSSGDRDQLKDLKEAEKTLTDLGIELEPKFDISLMSRIGARVKSD